MARNMATQEAARREDQDDQAIPLERRLLNALEALESAVESRLEREAGLDEVEAGLQRMGADRERLAESLDRAQARSLALEAANRQASEALSRAIGAIRSALDSGGEAKESGSR